MTRWVRASFALFAFGALAAPALAQGRGGFGMGMGGGGAMMVLRNPDVHKELKLSEEQVGKLTALAEELQGSMQDRFQGLQDLSPEERRDAMMKMQKEMNEEVAGKVKGYFSEEQMTRYNQLVLQSRGAQAWADEEIATKLKITDEQKKKLAEIQEAYMAEMRDSRQGGGGDPQAMQAKMAEMRKANTEKVMAVLTPDQKKMWSEMTGKPFEFRMQMPRRRDG